MKKQLKVLALTTSVLFGLNSTWAANFVAVDSGGTDVTNGTVTVNTKYESFSVAGADVAASAIAFTDGAEILTLPLGIASSDTQATVAARLQTYLRTLSTVVINGVNTNLEVGDLSIEIHGVTYRNSNAIPNLTAGGPHTITFGAGGDASNASEFDFPVGSPDDVNDAGAIIDAILAAVTVTPSNPTNTDLPNGELSFDLGVGNNYASSTVLGDWATSGSATIASIGMTQAATKVDLLTSIGSDLTVTAATPSRDGRFYVAGPGTTTFGALTDPSSGRAYVDVAASAVAVSANPSDAFVFTSMYGAGAAGATLTGAAGAWAADLVLDAPMTLATITSVTGEVSGRSNLILPDSVFAMSGSMIEYRGAIVTPGSGRIVTMSTLPPNGTIEIGAADTVVVDTAATLGKLRLVGEAAGILNASANVIIKELDLTSAAATLAPGDGITITVQKIIGGSDNTITIDGHANGVVRIARNAGDTSAGIIEQTGSLDDQR